MKKVSIIIPLYNLEKLIGKCIASALGQDLSPEEYEISGHRRRVDGRIARSRRKGGAGAPQCTCIYQTQRGAEPHAQLRHRPRRWRYVMYLDADDYLRTECPRPPGGNHGVRRARHAVLRNSWNRRKRQRRPTLSDGISAGNGSDVQRGVDFLQRDRFLPMVYAYLYSQGDARRQLAADGSDLA